MMAGTGVIKKPKKNTNKIIADYPKTKRVKIKKQKKK